MLKKLLILTGDASGDAHASRVIRKLKADHPQIEIHAVGGVEIQATGVEIIENHDKLGAIAMQAFTSIHSHIKLGQKIMNHIEHWQPDAVLLVDYGGFHLRMAQQIRKRFKSIKLFYYIPPQLWASREGRIKFFKNTIDHVFCIFPFEVPFYQKHGIPVTFVGHPILETLRPIADTPELRRDLSINLEKPVIAILPGSRKSEVSQLLEPLLSALPLIAEKLPVPHQFVLVQAKSIDDSVMNKLMDRHEHYIANLDFHWVRGGRHHDVLAISQAALAASGTVTLEAALYLTPSVITYKVAAILLALKPLLLKTKYFGLPNILLNKLLLPELLNREVNAQRICEAFMQIYDNRVSIDLELSGLRAALEGGHEDSNLTSFGASSAVSQLLISLCA